MSGGENLPANPLAPALSPLHQPPFFPSSGPSLPLHQPFRPVTGPESDLSLLGDAARLVGGAPSQRPTGQGLAGQVGRTEPGNRPSSLTGWSLRVSQGGDFQVCTRPHHGELIPTLLGALDPRPGQAVLRIGTVLGADPQTRLLGWLVGPFGSVTAVEPSSWPTVPPPAPEQAPEAPSLAGWGQTAPDLDADLGLDAHGRAPHLGRHDRVLVTQGVAGLPAAWARELAPDGLLVAPIAHGGVGRLITVTPDDDGGFFGQGVDWCVFLPVGTSADPAMAGLPEPPAPWHTAPRQAMPREQDSILPDLDDDDYRSLWFAMACIDKRVTRVPGDLGGPDGFGLADPVLGTIGLHRDRLRLAGEDLLVAQASKLLQSWETLGRPSPDRWRCSLSMRGSLLVPEGWSCVTWVA